MIYTTPKSGEKRRNKMVKKLIKLAIVFVSAGIGSLIVWTLMNWIPDTTILLGAVVGGYIAWQKA